MSRSNSETTYVQRWPILLAGILSLSTGSILIRMADAPALAVGAWRMLLATLLLTPWALPALVREWRLLNRRDVVLLVLSGVALAAHFATWITSLSFTTVSSSVILVSTNPIWVALIARFVLGERISSMTVLAIGIALGGSVLISYGDLGLTPQALLGDLLALFGALAASVYILLGRALRRKLSTLAYVWPCYGLASVLMLAASLVSNQPVLGYSIRTFGMFLLLALLPQIVGHSSINWALAHVSPIVVTMVLLGEPVGATLLAWLLLSEQPVLTALAGGALILLGVVIASREEAIGRSRMKSATGPTPKEHCGL